MFSVCCLDMVVCLVVINCAVVWFVVFCVFAVVPPPPCLCVVIRCMCVLFAVSCVMLCVRVCVYAYVYCVCVLFVMYGVVLYGLCFVLCLMRVLLMLVNVRVRCDCGLL